jgi:putative ATPase
MQKAKSQVADHPNAKVPLHLRNAPTQLMKDLGYGKRETSQNPNDSFLPKEIK